MDRACVDAIVEHHGGDPGSLIQVLLDIRNELHWLPVEHRIIVRQGRAAERPPAMAELEP